MSFWISFGILLPLLGTALGSASAYLPQKGKCNLQSSCLSGFTAGIMIAASVWSLILPSVEMSAPLGFFAFFPMLTGLWFGIFFLTAIEKPLAKLAKRKNWTRLSFFIAVVLHNIPEGMAVGVAFAPAIKESSAAGILPALILSIGMAIQNIPEGAIISLPLTQRGTSGTKSFVFGSLSGIVEPLAAIITLSFSSVSAAFLPYLLGFAAGAMIYVSVKELLPEAAEKSGVLWFFIGFSLMMVLDISLG